MRVHKSFHAFRSSQITSLRVIAKNSIQYDGLGTFLIIMYIFRHVLRTSNEKTGTSDRTYRIFVKKTDSHVHLLARKTSLQVNATVNAGFHVSATVISTPYYLGVYLFR